MSEKLFYESDDDFEDSESTENDDDIRDANNTINKNRQYYEDFKNIQAYFSQTQKKKRYASSPLPINNDTSSTIKSIAEAIFSILQLAFQRRLTFLLIGRTGVGKSSTVNSLIGKVVALTGEFKATTMSVESYATQIDGIDIDIIDTPGLCDDLEEKGNDQIYLNKIRRKVRKLDCLLFITPIHETRLRPDEMRGIRLISDALGSQVWAKSVIVLTFADLLPEDEYNKHFVAITDLIRGEISKYSGNKIAREIPSIAASNRSKKTPDGQLWLGELYAKVFTRISDDGALPFFLATANRIKFNDSETSKKPSLSFQQTISTKVNPSNEEMPSIILNQQQEIQINERIKNSTGSDIKELFELFALGASLGFTISGSNPIGAIVGGTIFAGAELISRFFRWWNN